MTKIAYLRASQQNPGLSFPSPQKPPMFAPMMPNGAMIRPQMMGAQMPHHMQRCAPQRPAPKPMLMMPTTRFNSNPQIPEADMNNRISKPLMEKRRRARINQCLSQLKQIVVDAAGQQTQNNKCKLEKADILELTVDYVKKLYTEKTQNIDNIDQGLSFVAGYSECARRVSDFIGDSEPTMTELPGHLNQCLTEIQQQVIKPSPSPTFVPLQAPPSPAFSSQSFSSGHSSMASFSPVALHMLKPRSSSEFEEYEEEYESSSETEETFSHHSNMDLPINLSKSAEPGAWRPW